MSSLIALHHFFSAVSRTHRRLPFCSLSAIERGRIPRSSLKNENPPDFPFPPSVSMRDCRLRSNFSGRLDLEKKLHTFPSHTFTVSGTPKFLIFSLIWSHNWWSEERLDRQSPQSVVPSFFGSSFFPLQLSKGYRSIQVPLPSLFRTSHCLFSLHFSTESSATPTPSGVFFWNFTPDISSGSVV